jgi:hypothetical protein
MVNILKIQLNFLGQTAMSRCEGLRKFQGLTPFPTSGCCWWFGYNNRFLNVRGQIGGDFFPIKVPAINTPCVAVHYSRETYKIILF